MDTATKSTSPYTALQAKPILTPLDNVRHERFCNEYLTDFNGSASAIRAGYAKSGSSTEGNRLLGYADVRARLAGLQAKRFKRVKINADYVLKKAHEIVERCLKEVEPVMGRGGAQREEGEKCPECGEGAKVYTFQAQTAVKALEIIGKHVEVGAFNPDINIEGGTINVLVGGKPCTCGLCTCRPAPRSIEVGKTGQARALRPGGAS